MCTSLYIIRVIKLQVPKYHHEFECIKCIKVKINPWRTCGLNVWSQTQLIYMVLTKFIIHVLFMYVFETLLYTLSYIKEKRKYTHPRLWWSLYIVCVCIHNYPYCIFEHKSSMTTKCLSWLKKCTWRIRQEYERVIFDMISSNESMEGRWS